MIKKQRHKQLSFLLLTFLFVTLLSLGSLLTISAIEDPSEIDELTAAQFPAKASSVISSETADETAAGVLQSEALAAASSSEALTSKLPLPGQTQNLPPAVFYLLGLGLAGIGMAARKSETPHKTHQL